jgi:hypothetical protein
VNRLTAIATAALCAAALPALASEPEATAPGCTVVRTATDAEGVGTFVSECRWAVAYEFVERAFSDDELLEEANSNLGEGIDLGDGRSINVHTPGFPIADRQSTLESQREPLPGGGFRSLYWQSARQAPLEPGRVQVRIDEGTWQIRPAEGGGTALRYEMRYDAGGNLAPWVVRRFQAKGIATSLDEMRRAAEALAARVTPEAGEAPQTSR